MNRNPLAVTIMLVAILILAWGSNSSAVLIQTGDQITVSGLSPAAIIYGGRGGPYNAVVTSPAGYSQTFLTFCLEIHEYLTFNSTFYVGGVSDKADGSGDPLDPFTAYLYTKALNGGYDAGQLDDVQFAIWRQEDEISSFPDNAYATFYKQELEAYKSIKDWNGGENIKVINLKDQWGHNAQDLIVSVPETPAVATLVLGMGLIGFAGYYESRVKSRKI